MAHDSWTDGRRDIPVIKHVGERGTCQAPICRAYYSGLRKGWDIKAKHDADYEAGK